MLDVNALLAAFGTAHYVLGGALLVTALVTAAKQGYLSTKLAMWLPPSALPWVAIGLGVLGTTSTELTQGIAFWSAVRDGVLAGISAVFTHQTVIEGMRRGKEIVPETRAKVFAESIRPPRPEVPIKVMAPLPPLKPSEIPTIPPPPNKGAA